MAPAGDRFDSDCVVGTQFESSQPHHAVLRKQRFPGSSRITPNCRGFDRLRDYPLTRSDWRKLLRPGAFLEMFSIHVGDTPKTSRSLAAEYPLANFVSI